MKLIRFGEFRRKRPGILADDGSRRDCSSLFRDWNSAFFAEDGVKKLSCLDVDKLPIVPERERWGSCVV